MPQVASRGKNHYKSFKFYNETDAFTGIKKLNKEKRVEEIAKMISGEVITEEALKVATQLINEKNKSKDKIEVKTKNEKVNRTRLIIMIIYIIKKTIKKFLTKNMMN